MKTFLTNAFSLNMVAGTALLQVGECAPESVPVNAISAIGHKETAEVVSELLGRKVEANRVPVTLDKGDTACVVTLFTLDSKPFRPPEGRVLTADELRQLKVVVRSVTVL